MIPLPSAVSSGFTWSRLPRNRGYEFKRNGEIVGTLERTSFWSSNVLAKNEQGSWTIRKTGCLGNKCEIVDPASQQRIAKFKAAWGGRGALAFADGQTFYLERKGFWRPVWAVTTEAGVAVLSLHASERTVDISGVSGVPESRLSLLAMFTLYRVQQAEEDAAAAAVVVAAIS